MTKKYYIKLEEEYEQLIARIIGKEIIIIKDISKLSLEEITECLKIYNETGKHQIEGGILERIAEIWDEYIPKEDPTIEQIKKQIKYSKNPLEVKMLNKKLNELYKKNNIK